MVIVKVKGDAAVDQVLTLTWITSSKGHPFRVRKSVFLVHRHDEIGKVLKGLLCGAQPQGIRFHAPKQRFEIFLPKKVLKSKSFNLKE